MTPISGSPPLRAPMLRPDPARTELAGGLMQMRAAVLEKNAALRELATAVPSTSGTGAATSPNDFAGILRTAVGQVDALSHNAERASTAIETGASHDIAGAMIARQKAALGFEATLQVRNKLLSAYQDVMNMPL